MPDESNPGPKPDKSRRHAPARPISERLFYSGAAALLLVLTLVGFMPYYLHGKAFSGRDIASAVHTLILMHATVMTT
jgi:short subunit fatty acids transporter